MEEIADFDIKMTQADMDAFLDIIRTGRIIQSYLNDETIHGAATVMTPLLKMLNGMAGTDLVDVLERSLQDPNLDRALLNPPKVGMYGLIKEMGNEDVQKGMGITIELLKALGRASGDIGQ
jgi:uncharacterized protein YjgD (DUF1641 family)